MFNLVSNLKASFIKPSNLDKVEFSNLPETKNVNTPSLNIKEENGTIVITLADDKDLELFTNGNLSIGSKKNVIIHSGEYLHLNPMDNEGKPIGVKDVYDYNLQLDYTPSQDFHLDVHKIDTCDVDLSKISKEMLYQEIKELSARLDKLEGKKGVCKCHQ